LIKIDRNGTVIIMTSGMGRITIHGEEIETIIVREEQTQKVESTRKPVGRVLMASGGALAGVGLGSRILGERPTTFPSILIVTGLAVLVMGGFVFFSGGSGNSSVTDESEGSELNQLGE
jgi:hypothetical protein